MSLSSWLSWPLSRSRRAQRRIPKHRVPAPRPKTTRLCLEQLEDRALPSSYTADTAANLIKDIDAANNAGGANTITLAAATTAPYVLTAVDNTTDGATGLPVIANNDNLTIVGSGDTVERSTVSGTPGFRLLDVAAGASLTLQNLTLQNGQAHGADPAGDGGAAYNQGTLVLNGVTVQNNGADAGGGIYSAGSLTLEAGSTVRSNVAPLGGGIYSTGVLTLEGGTVQGNSAQVGGGIYSTGVLTLEAGTTVQDNHAQGVNGYPLAYQYYGYGYGGPATPGGNGLGGGIYVAGGTAALSNATLFSNTATGGKGGWGGSYGGIYGGGSYSGAAGGSGLGGALAVSGGNVSLTSVTMSSNAAQGGPGGFAGFVQYNPAYLWRGGNGLGGAVEVSGGTVILTTVTLSANTAQGGAGGTGVYGYRSVALGGYGGTGFGGALGVSGGTVISQGTASLTNATVVAANTALGGAAGPGLRIGHAGAGGGGGTYIASTATTYLDSSTVAGTSNNTDATGTNGSTANIDGTNTAPSTYLQPPTVANAASATPSAVTGSTTSLSVLGNDPNDGNESYLSYTWIVTSAPAGAATPTFASNGTNASKSTTATFYRAGNYTIKVTLSDSYKLTTDSSVNVIVSQTATSISVSPVSVTMPVRSQQPFQATTFDQFGQPMTTQPSGYTWSIAGGGIGSI